jgi:diadenosine tetraphosphate (Ap4A) HIT family hydrolase
MFVLDPAIEAASLRLGDLPLCEARLMLDARFDWLVLVPRVAGATEIEDLTEAGRNRLMAEIVLAGNAVRAMGAARGRPVAKLNVGALGNITPQLHIHVVGRRPDDAAWPGPVWGFGKSVSYGEAALAVVVQAAKRGLPI